MDGAAIPAGGPNDIQRRACNVERRKEKAAIPFSLQGPRAQQARRGARAATALCSPTPSRRPRPSTHARRHRPRPFRACRRRRHRPRPSTHARRHRPRPFRACRRRRAPIHAVLGLLGLTAQQPAPEGAVPCSASLIPGTDLTRRFTR
jgi:hypothetical protein